MVHWPLIGGWAVIWYSEMVWAAPAQAISLYQLPNVTVHPSMPSVPITVLLYNGPLLCGFTFTKYVLPENLYIFMLKKGLT